MNMQEAVSSVLSQYAGFTGRARRSEYWFWVLATFVVSLGIGIVEAIIGTSFLGWLFIVATFVPSISVGARRLHDIGKSGWLQLIGIIPIIGWIILIVWFATDSQPDNQYGPNPKGWAPGTYGQAPPTV